MEDYHKKCWFKSYISSKIPILVRSSLLVLGQISDISEREKLDILRDENIKILDIRFKEELFMLYSDIFPKLDDDDKKLFLNKLMSEEKLNEKFTDESYFYQKYNLLIWLKRFDEHNRDIEKFMNEILNKYSHFKPRENPQKSIGPITTRWGDGPLPYSESEIINNLEELFVELLSYSGDGFKRAERYTLINTLENICITNIEFRDKLIDLLLSSHEFETDLWKSVIRSLEKADIPEDMLIDVFEKIFIKSLIKIYTLEFSSAIYSNIKSRDNMSNDLVDYLYEKNKLIWAYAKNLENDNVDYMTKAFNSSKGYIALSTVLLIDISTKNKGQRYLEDRFKEFLETMISKEEYNDTLVVILGNASFLYSLDKSWCEEHILDKYSSSDSTLLKIAWKGFVYQSNLYPEFALIIEPKFHEAIRRINIFEEDLRESILKRYMSLMVNISNDPIKEYISNIFTKKPLNTVLELFYYELSRYIESLDKIGRNEIFDKWILEFIVNRTKSKPILTLDHEKNLILKFLLNFPDRVTSLDEIFISLEDYFKVNQETLDFLSTIDVTKDNSEIINKVLIIITSQMKRNTQDIIPDFIQFGIKDIYEKVSKNGVDTKILEENIRFMNIIK